MDSIKNPAFYNFNHAFVFHLFEGPDHRFYPQAGEGRDFLSGIRNLIRIGFVPVMVFLYIIKQGQQPAGRIIRRQAVQKDIVKANPL